MGPIGARCRAFRAAVGSAPVPPDTTVHSIALPPGAEPPIRVYVNGEEWTEGGDFAVEGDVVRFLRPLRAQPPLGFWHKVMLAIGVGVYGDLRGDTLDLAYRQGGVARTASVPLTPGEARGAPRGG